MTNENVLVGIACPKCKAEEPFDIDGRATFLMVEDDGCSDFMAMEWDEESGITCRSCGHRGIVEEFRVHEDENEDETPQGEVVPVSTLTDFLKGLQK